MRPLIRFIYNLFGITVYFINPKKYGKNSAINSNKKESLNISMGDEKITKVFERKDNLIFYSKVVELPQINLSDKSIVDVGCGSGILLNIIHKTYKPKQLHGMDFSETCVNITKQKNIDVENLKLKIHDLYNSLEEKYDVIFCTEVLEHLLYPEIALLNIVNALNADGMAIITVPNGKLDIYDGHINFWSIDSFGVFLTKYLDPDMYNIVFDYIDNNHYDHLYTKITKKPFNKNM